MSRYRPPQPKSSPYITHEGFAALQREEKAIWQRRKETTAALSEAAAEGDRSENAEYIYRKKELRELDRRIRYLQKRLPDLQVVDASIVREQVFFGAWVTYTSFAPVNTDAATDTDAGDATCTVRVRIVGADEIDPERGYISVDSPMARALLKKSIDDEVRLTVAGRELVVEIVAIEYC